MQNNVKILIGSHGSGKSNWIYNYFFSNAVKPDRKIDLAKKLYLIVPEQDTNDKQRLLMKEAEKRNLGAGIINIDVVSFDRIAHNVFSILNIEPESENVIEDDAKTMMLALALSKLNKEGKIKYYKRMANKIGFAKKLTQVVSEFYSYDVKSEDIDKVIENSKNSNLKDKLSDLKLIYEEFKKELIYKHFSIKEDKYNLLSKNIDKVDIFDGAYVAFDGFTGFTPVQLDIFKKIAKKAKEVYVTIDIRDTKGLYSGEKPIMSDLFYLSKKFVNDIAKALSTVSIELPFSNYIDLNKESVIKFSGKNDFMFLEKHLFDYSDDIEKVKAENILFLSAKNIKEEVKNVCDMILDYVRNKGYKFSDIKVIVPKVEEYADIVLKACNKYNIPIFIDDSTGIFNSPYIETIRAALDVVNFDFKYDSVMRYISSGIVEKDKRLSLLDNYIRKYGIRGHKAYNLISDEYKGIFIPLIKFYDDIYSEKKKTNTIAKYLDALKIFINEIKLDEQFKIFIETLDKESKNYAKELKILETSIKEAENTFKNLYVINDENKEEYTIEDFRKVLDVGLDAATVKTIPFLLDQVIVGDFMRSRFDNPKICFILGLNQSRIPGQMLDLSIIDDKMREQFEKINISLSQTTTETALNQRFYTYIALTNPTEKLILSYTRLNSDDEVDEKSSIIKEVERLIDVKEERVDINNIRFFNSNEIIDFIAENIDITKKYYFIDKNYDESLKKKAIITKNLVDYMKLNDDFKDYFEKVLSQKNYIKNEVIPKEIIEEIHKNEYKDGFVASATAIESFNKCPYSYYLKNTIKLREREYFEVNSLDLGNFYHAALKTIFSNSFDLKKEKNIENVVDNAICKMRFDNYKFSIDTNKVKYIKDRSRAVLITSLKVLKSVSENSKLSIYKTERAFSYDDGKSKINGRIDVIDKYNDEDKTYVNIIDYKSGKKSIKIDDIVNGVDIQLTLYLDYCLSEKLEKSDKEVIPCGSFYFTLDNPIIKLYDYSDINNIDKKVNESMGFVGIASDVENNVKMIDDSLEKEKSGKDSVYVSKESGINISGVSLSEEDLNTLRKQVKDKISESVDAINSGIISKTPYEKLNECEYCSYKNICRKEFSYEA